MDRTDREIIDVLMFEGRIPNVELADRVNLTPGPCLRRVQRLEDDGVIQGYRAIIDPKFLGQSFEVILDVELKAFDKKTVDAFEEAIAGFDEVMEVQRMFGQPDYYVKIAVEDLVTYEKFLSENILTLPGILKVHSRFTMKTVK